MSSQQDRDAGNRVLLGSKMEKTITVQSAMDPDMKGEITFALPTIRELARIAVIQSDLRQGRSLDVIDGLSAGMIIAAATLAVVVRKAPSWWYRKTESKDAPLVAAPEELRDTELFWDIWEEYTAFSGSFPRRRRDEASGADPKAPEPAPTGESAEPAAVR